MRRFARFNKFDTQLEEFIAIESVIGKKRNPKFFKRLKFIGTNRIYLRLIPLSNKHRCPSCRKKRTFTTMGLKAWVKKGSGYVCCFCNAKENNTLELLQLRMGKLRKTIRLESKQPNLPII